MNCTKKKPTDLKHPTDRNCNRFFFFKVVYLTNFDTINTTKIFEVEKLKKKNRASETHPSVARADY